MTATVLIVVTHLLGAGHLVRATALARAFAAAGHRVALVSGGMPAGREGAGLRVVQLPPVKIVGTAFTTLLDERGCDVTEELLSERRAILTALVEQIRPDVIVTELYPFGRRVLADEFEAMLAAGLGLSAKPLILSSIRDILAEPSKRERIERTHARLVAAYDAVLVHGDPSLVPIPASWPGEIPRPLIYTGYVDEGVDEGSAGDAQGEILVSGGSSAAGLPLQEAAISAAAIVRERSWRILVGRGVEQSRHDALADAAPPNAVVERARSDFRGLLRGCAVSVSQAGYNTAVDLLRAGCRAILVPFEAGRETEQRLRAEALSRAGLAVVLPEADLSAEALAAAVREVVRSPRPSPPEIALDGAARSVAAVERLLRGRS